MLMVVLSVTAPELDHIAIGGVRLQSVLAISIANFLHTTITGVVFEAKLRREEEIADNVIKFYLLWQHSLGNDLTCNSVDRKSVV